MRLNASSSLICSLIMLQASIAVAEDVYVTVGSRVPNPTNSGLESFAEGDKIVLDLSANRSYACTFILANDGIIDMETEITAPEETTIEANECGRIEPKITASGTDTSIKDNRLCFTAEANGIHYLNVASGSGAGTSNNVTYSLGSVECLETTLYGGYNTNLNEYNFLELENTTGSTIKAQVTVRLNDGSIAVDKALFTVKAGSRSDIDIHTATGAEQFGSVIVTHDGPFGALKGRVSLYGTTSSGNIQLNGQIPLTSKESTL